MRQCRALPLAVEREIRTHCRSLYPGRADGDVEAHGWETVCVGWGGQMNLLSTHDTQSET
eukprot:3024059-Prymnesium_polylepis.1